MCGINGIVDYKASIDDSIVHAMNDSLAHRGPDGEGIFTSRTRNVALGNRRLSIVDIDNGSQPVVVTHNGYEFAITYNGEVYNHKELRHELESRGYKFKTNSDTEVVLNAYVEFGERCVDRFNGQFAFAIYDGKKDSVYLARDKFGIKPLYYANVNGALVFSSEPKGILTHPNFNAKPNLETIADFFLTMDIFTDGHISLNRTFFDGIHALEPGMYCVVDRNGSEIQRYWDVNIHTDNPDEITEELIRNAVSIRIPDEVRVGTALSGGLDSSIVTYLTLQQGHQLPAATVKYNGVKYNPDWDHAQLFADEFGVENLCVGLDANTLLDDIDPMIRAMDEPHTSIRQLGLYATYRALSNAGCKVVLVGEGADEFNMGYFWDYPGFFKDHDKVASANSLRTFMQRKVGFVSRYFTRDFLDGINFNTVIDSTIENYYSRCKHPDKFERMRYYYAKKFLKYRLDANDKCGMAHSVEARVPFLDPGVVAAALSIPYKDHLRFGSEKYPLRHAFETQLPQAIIDRRKYSFPESQDVRFHKMVADELDRNMYGINSEVWDIFDRNYVTELNTRFRRKLSLLHGKDATDLTTETAMNEDDDVRIKHVFSVLTFMRWFEMNFG